MVEKCNGYKVPDLDCKSIRKSLTQPKPLEDKPEVKTEVKPEVKPENPVTLGVTQPKPTEAKPEAKPEVKQETIPEVPKPQVTQPTPSPEVQATQPIPEVQPKPTPPSNTSISQPRSNVSTTNTSNRQVSQGKQGRQARLTGFIDKPTQPSIPTQNIEEDWSKILRPEKKKVIPCSELGDECRFFTNCLELFEWRSWSGERVFEPPRGYIEIEGLFTPEEHERLHKKLYELVINGKQQEALKLWEEIAEKELPTRIEKARRRNREILMDWVRKHCSDNDILEALREGQETENKA
jgi:hypothetical protein